MVYVNSKKFAWYFHSGHGFPSSDADASSPSESCIKGHRSSSCHHTDRPLFEIKKKGRPVSQCTKCRELRQSKKFHSKCTCNHMMEEVQAVQPLASSSNSKSGLLSSLNSSAPPEHHSSEKIHTYSSCST
ncbi:hypothetical protein BDZ97DRAFT_398793 [Flammula alnicola]|nr:hypothetical protein BDZ97DRAFT_398793 [Flammula alnicola]